MKINLIDYIVKKTGLKQKDLAAKLQVSRAQISKWKSGEYIPIDRENSLMKIANLFGNNPEWAILSKTEKNSQAWIEYILHMNDSQDDYYNSSSIIGDPNFQIPQILITLYSIGISIPPEAPEVPSEQELSDDTYEYTKFDELTNNYLECYGPLDVWVQNFFKSDHDELSDFELSIECLMVDFAICFMNEELLISHGVEPSRLAKYKEETQSAVRKDIVSMCHVMRNKNIPFTTNYFDLINEDLNYIDNQVLMLEVKSRSIENYFSIGERILLSEIRKTQHMLTAIHQKVDTFLAEKQ